MTYESMDWEIESTRVANAFAINEPCHFFFYDDKERSEHFNFGFVIYGNYGSAYVIQNGVSTIKTPREDRLNLKVIYDKKSKSFRIQKSIPSYPKPLVLLASLKIGWDKEIISVDQCPGSNDLYDCDLVLAKGLYNLDLLTPPIEAALECSISAHQKIEWKLEYEERRNSFS